MKTRNGFVSNSSSSSFIVFLNKDMTRNELQEVLFQDATEHERYGNTYPISEIMDRIYRDYDSQTPMHVFDDEEAIVEEMCCGHYDGAPSMPMLKEGLSKEERWQRWDFFDEINRATAEEVLRKAAFRGSILKGDWGVYFFEYGDGTPFGAVLEHGDTFGRVKHIRVSKH